MTDVTIYNGTLRLAASVHGPTVAPDVLCLHGISGSRDTWEETVCRLENRYRVWTLDYRGHGHSDRADTAASLAQDPHPQVIAVFLYLSISGFSRSRSTFGFQLRFTSSWNWPENH